MSKQVAFMLIVAMTAGLVKPKEVCFNNERDCSASDGHKYNGVRVKGNEVKISELMNNTNYKTAEEMILDNLCLNATWIGDHRSQKTEITDNFENSGLDIDPALEQMGLRIYGETFGLLGGLFNLWEQPRIVLKENLYLYEGNNAALSMAMPASVNGPADFRIIPEPHFLHDTYALMYELIIKHSVIEQKFIWETGNVWPKVDCDGEWLIIADDRTTTTDDGGTYSLVDDSNMCGKIRPRTFSGTFTQTWYGGGSHAPAYQNARLGTQTSRYGLCFTGAPVVKRMVVLSSWGPNNQVNINHGIETWPCDCREETYVNATCSPKTFTAQITSSNYAQDIWDIQSNICNAMPNCVTLELPSDSGRIYPALSAHTTGGSTAIREAIVKNVAHNCSCGGFRNKFNVELEIEEKPGLVEGYCGTVYDARLTSTAYDEPPYKIWDSSCLNTTRHKRGVHLGFCVIICLGGGGDGASKEDLEKVQNAILEYSEEMAHYQQEIRTRVNEAFKRVDGNTAAIAKLSIQVSKINDREYAFEVSTTRILRNHESRLHTVEIRQAQIYLRELAIAEWAGIQASKRAKLAIDGYDVTTDGCVIVPDGVSVPTVGTKETVITYTPGSSLAPITGSIPTYKPVTIEGTDGLDWWVILLICVGGVVVLIIVSCLAWKCCTSTSPSYQSSA